MALNIKDEAALDELRRLSDITGRSMTKELSAAIHERLRRVEKAGDARLHRLLELAETSGKLWPEAMRDGDPTAPLYDEHGLPA